jgi:hypothetical protein
MSRTLTLSHVFGNFMPSPITGSVRTYPLTAL